MLLFYPGADNAASKSLVSGQQDEFLDQRLCTAELAQTWTGRRLGNRAAQNSCYTGAMEKTRQNVTLVVEEDLLLAARKVALDQRTSVNQLVREYLTALVEEPGRRRLARARLRRAFETGLVEVGEWNWSRDDLYDR